MVTITGQSIALILLLFMSAQAQVQDTVGHEGMKGLRFSFNGLNLGGGVGGKYWFSDQRSIAAGIGLSFRSDANNSTQTGIDLFGQYEYHFQPHATFSPYLAGGTSIGINSYNPLIGVHSSEIQLSLIGALGVEVFITKAISFAGQQSLSLTYIHTTYSLPASSTTGAWKGGLGSSSLLLHVYF